jgi:putative ATP-binding cassette transporter
VALAPGERILLAGEHSADRTLVFRALIGIWPWGSGRITRPLRQAMMFLPARAYVPPGTLRAALAYPHAAGDFAETALTQALADVGLEPLQELLDTDERWDRRLNDDEKQRLTFARVILQRPQWLVMNGGLDLLDSVSRGRIEAIFTDKLATVGVIDVGEDSAARVFFTRKLGLVTDPHGPTFGPADQRAIALPG